MKTTFEEIEMIDRLDSDIMPSFVKIEKTLSDAKLTEPEVMTVACLLLANLFSRNQPEHHSVLLGAVTEQTSNFLEEFDSIKAYIAEIQSR